MGLDDGSQAIYCLGWGENASRPVGDGLMGFRSAAHTRGLSQRGPTQTVPYGTDLLASTFQAINSLATFIPSLRDNGSLRRVSVQ